MSAHAPVGGRLITKPFLVLSGLALLAFGILAIRFIFGLDAVTNINDGYPWGVWIVADVMIGTAFGCAGFSMALLVYLLNKGEYHPLVRPAVLAGLFGYTLAGLAVMFDLGRYWQFYTLLLPWYMQPNSVMLEVALCVMAYIVVLWLEFSPAFLERLGFDNIKKSLNKVMFLIIAIGVLLPTMHQSSLGTLLVVLGHQLSPLWQTQLLPVLSLMTALLMGFAIVPFEGMLASMGFRRPAETDILGKLAGITVMFLAAYLIIRFVDLILRGALGSAFAGDLDAIMFWLENLLYAIPLIILIKPVNRFNPRLMFISAFTLLLAGCVFRFNAYLIGYHPAGGGWNYFPSVPEIMVTVGMFSLEVVAYLIVVKYLPVLPRAEHAPEAIAGQEV